MVYNNENVLLTIGGRLYPVEDMDTVPECNCVINITDSKIYVAEDNFDGTYTDHYVIKHEDIEGFGITKPYDKTVNPDGPKRAIYQDRSMAFNFLPMHGVVYAISELIDFRLADKPGNIKAAFLTIVFKDENGKLKHFFVNECNKNAYRFAKQYNKIILGK